MMKLFCTFETHYLTLLDQAEQGSFFARTLLLPLIPISYLYGAITSFIRAQRKKRKRRTSLFSVAVGNIVAGGTGKTPLIAQLLEEVGADQALYVSRGYLRPNTTSLVITRGKDASYETCGDEATLLGKRFPSLHMMITGSQGKQRVFDMHHTAASWMILDDALQHDEIDAHLKIATLDAKNPYGYHRLLPRGTLREYPEERLPLVDYIVVTNCEKEEKSVVRRVEQQWKKPTIATQTTLTRFFDIARATVTPPDNSFFLLISAIARPERIRALLERSISPQHIGPHLMFPDHGNICEKMVLQWIKHLEIPQGPVYLIATEKDWAQLAAKKWSLPFPLIFTEIGFKILHGKHHWTKCCELIRKHNLGTLSTTPL